MKRTESKRNGLRSTLTREIETGSLENKGRNPNGVAEDLKGARTQGDRCAATLGFVTNRFAVVRRSF